MVLAVLVWVFLSLPVMSHWAMMTHSVCSCPRLVLLQSSQRRRCCGSRWSLHSWEQQQHLTLPHFFGNLWQCRSLLILEGIAQDVAYRGGPWWLLGLDWESSLCVIGCAPLRKLINVRCFFFISSLTFLFRGCKAKIHILSVYQNA